MRKTLCLEEKEGIFNQLEIKTWIVGDLGKREWVQHHPSSWENFYRWQCHVLSQQGGDRREPRNGSRAARNTSDTSSPLYSFRGVSTLRKFPHNSVFPAWLCHGEKLWKSNLWKLWSLVRNLSHIFSRESQDMLLKAFPSMWEKFPVKKSWCSSSHLYLFWADPKARPSPRGPFSRYILYRV